MKRTLFLNLSMAAANVPIVHAETLNATWLGGNGTWTIASNWSGGVVPNNSGTQTFAVTIPAGTASIPFVSGQPTIAVDLLQIHPTAVVSATTLRIERQLQSDGTLAVTTGVVAADALFDGSGTLLVSSQFWCDGGPLVLPAGLTVVNGSSQASIGVSGQPTINNGKIVGAWSTGGFDNGFVIKGSTFLNSGTLSGSGFARYINIAADSWSADDVGQTDFLNFAGIIAGGVVNNQGKTIRFGSSTGLRAIRGEIVGGTLTTDPGFVVSGPREDGTMIVLNDVRVDGQIGFSELRPGSIRLRTDTLRGGGTVILQGSSASIGTERDFLRIAKGMTVDCQWSGPASPFPVGRLNGGTSRQIVVDGMLRASSPVPIPSASEFFPTYGIGGKLVVSGVLELHGGQVMKLPNGFETAAGGTVRLSLLEYPQQFMDITGVFDLRAPNDRLEIIPPANVQYGDVFYLGKSIDHFVQGQFDYVTPGFEVFGNPGEIVVRYVPEPLAALPCFAVAFALCCRRRSPTASRSIHEFTGQTYSSV